MDKITMTRQQKENYLIKMLIDEGLIDDSTKFREKLQKISDITLDIKIESMKMYLDED